MMTATKASVLAIVEDEPDVRMLVRITLTRDPRLEILGEATSAEEAIEIARSLQPGVVILDHGLDGTVTGLEAAPLIKEAAPNSKILLFTAFDMAVEAREEPAVDAYLRKDRIGDLVAKVDELLGLDPL
jgi:DNA-binding NarL/FixJ family response regulator